MVEQLLNRGVSPNLEGDQIAIVEAVLRNDLISLRLLLEFGADPNLKSADGNPALRYACQHGYEEAATLLLSYGADPNIKSKFNSLTPCIYVLTAISFCSSRSFIEIYMSFISHSPTF
jgi:ankyrin repeat protein